MKTLQYKDSPTHWRTVYKESSREREPIQLVGNDNESVLVIRIEDLRKFLISNPTFLDIPLEKPDTRSPLTNEQIERIEQGFKSIEEGRCMTHQEHKKDFREWLQKEHNVTA